MEGNLIGGLTGGPYGNIGLTRGDGGLLVVLTPVDYCWISGLLMTVLFPNPL
jgi:hypothetical protein